MVAGSSGSRQQVLDSSASPMEGISTSWANIVAQSSKSTKLPLHYFKSLVNAQGIPSIKPPVNVPLERRKKWSTCLVGSFL